jgi:hypothetical protein
MSGNIQKTPLARTLPTFVSGRSLDEIAKQGLAIPGHVVAVSGAIITVSFDVAGLTISPVQMPLGSPEYLRLPIQKGDKGVAVPASFYLGGISGLGGGTATDTLQGNLSTLFWMPLGNKNWSAVDPNAVTIYGPNGVTLRDSASQTAATLTPGGVAITGGGLTVSTGASGTFTTPTGQTVTVQDGIVTNIF